MWFRWVEKQKKQKAEELLSGLNKKDLEAVLKKYEEDLKKKDNLIPEDKFNVSCPYCGFSKHIRRGKTKHLVPIFQCKNCSKRFNLFTDTIMDKTPYTWSCWVTIMEQMLKNQSIESITNYLIRNNIVPTIDYLTVSAMENKIRASFAHMPLPTLTNVIQVDEKHFKESQKGVKSPIDPLDPTKRRKPHHRSIPTLYGNMGPEMSTVCCAVDSSGHAIAKVVTMGAMRLEEFEDDIAVHFKDVKFLCSDMNPIYTQYASLRKIPQYVCNSGYHDVMKKCNTKQKKVAAYEQDKLDYIVGAGIMNYDQMVSFKKTNNLNINTINSYHSELERYQWNS